MMPEYTISTIALISASGNYVCTDQNGYLVAQGNEQRDPFSNELRLSCCAFKL